MASRGVVYVAVGPNAKEEAKKSIRTLRRHNNLDVQVISDGLINGCNTVTFNNPGRGARRAKLSIHNLVPWDNVLYIDADTRVHGNLEVGFDILEDGWDLVIVPSENQNENALWHVREEEREATLQVVPAPLQLQGGLFWFNRERCKYMFDGWLDEWLRWSGKDQAALLRALEKEHVKIWLMGRPFNGGSVVEHLFGRAR